MIKSQDIIICDKCGKSREYENNSYIRMSFSYRTREYEDHHFCSILCAVSWINETCQNELMNEIDTNLNEKIDKELKKIIKADTKIMEVD